MVFVKKALSKEITTRTRLTNKFFKDISQQKKKRYSKKCYYCVSLLEKSKSDNFGNLNEKRPFRAYIIINNLNINQTFSWMA